MFAVSRMKTIMAMGQLRMADPAEMARAKKIMSKWNYTTIVLVIIAAAFSLFICMNNLLLYQNGVDSVLVRCESDSKVGARNEWLSFLHGNYPCHHLRLKYPWLFDEASDNLKKSETAKCYVWMFLLASMIISSHFLVASLILLMFGIVKRKYVAFLPWLVVSLIVIIILGLMIFGEISMDEKGNFRVSSAIWPLLAILAFIGFTWTSAMISCLQIKKITNEPKEAKRMVNNFEYVKL